MSQPTTSEPPSNQVVRTSDKQIFCCKSIDKLISESEAPGQRLQKTLGPWSLTALGIGAVIGSGIFVLTGTAAAGEYFQAPSILHAQVLDIIWNFLRGGGTAQVLMHGRPAAGPSIAISFLLVAIACSFAGLCYAELASMIPIAGSAYTYSYATLGEIFAWIIGWDLILEYVVSNVVVAIGFSAYTKAQLASFNINLPDKWSTPVWESGHWTGSYFNFPAFLIIFILTVLLVRGIRESAEANNIMVAIKIGAILVFLFVGGALVNPTNWHPFAPSGFGGVVTGGAIVFFTYIGFDSVSTAAEECKAPKRDLPIGIIATLVVCTLLYIAVVVVLTGLVRWETLLDDAAPVVNTLKKLGFRNIQLIVLLGALTGMISSLLVFQLGQARVWFAMSRDGLLPGIFSRVHKRFRTPDFSTIMAGFLVGIPAGLLDIGTLADLSNIGTLFAFALVAGGVLILRYKQPDRPRAFRAPGGILAPVVTILTCLLLMAGLPITNWIRFFVWLLIGLCFYYFYGRRHSQLSDANIRADADKGKLR